MEVQGSDQAAHVGLILCRPLDCSIKFDTVKSGWFIVYTEGSFVIISKKILNFFLTNSTDPDLFL